MIIAVTLIGLLDPRIRAEADEQNEQAADHRGEPRAARAAFDEGIPYICDPAVHPAPIDELLGGQMTSKLQAAVRAAAPASRSPRHHGPRWSRLGP